MEPFSFFKKTLFLLEKQ